MGIQDIKCINNIKLFYGIMAILIGLFLCLLFSNPMGTQLNVFFLRTGDFMADFFNVQIYIADWDPYHNYVNGLGEKCYLPFTYLFLELFNGFQEYSGMTLQGCYSSSTSMVSCFLFVILSILVLFHAFGCLARTSVGLKTIIFFSSIMLFSIERGNIIIICAALLCYYLAFVDSPDKRKRFFALICLCIISVIKIYPVIFGLYLLKGRRYKDILFCFIISILLVFVPFLFFKGQLDNINQLLENLSVFKDSYSPYRLFPRFGLTPFVVWICGIQNVALASCDLLIFFTEICVIALSCVSLVLFFYEKIVWKEIAFLSLPLIMYPTNSAYYCGLYLLPSLLLFLKEINGGKMNYVYLFLFCILLNPVQIVIDDTAISWMISNIAVIIIWMLLIAESIITNRKMIRFCVYKQENK